MSFRRKNTYVREAKCVALMKFINPGYDDTKYRSNDIVMDLCDAIVQYVYIQDEFTINKRSDKVRVGPDEFRRNMKDHIVKTSKHFEFLDFKWKLISSLRSLGSGVDPFDFRLEIGSVRRLNDSTKNIPSLRWFARFCRKLFKETEYNYLFEDMLVYVSYGFITKDFLSCSLSDCKYVVLEMEEAILFVDYENKFSFIKLMLMYFSFYRISDKSVILRDNPLFDVERVYDYILVASDVSEFDDVGIVHKTVLSGHDDVN